MKKYLLGSLAVFVVLFALDILIHGVLLQDAYMASAALWRPQEEMNMSLMMLITAITSLTFTAIYAYFVRGESVATGVRYGLLYGIGAGFSYGMGTYAMMPLPMSLAWAWFLSFALETAIAGAVLGVIFKRR
jgi:hypothetical protein